MVTQLNAASRLKAAGLPLAPKSEETKRINKALAPLDIRLNDADKEDRGYIIPREMIRKRDILLELVDAYGGSGNPKDKGGIIHREWKTPAGVLCLDVDTLKRSNFFYMK